MDDKQFKILISELESLKALLVLQLQNADVESKAIAKTLKISPGRFSQIFATKKYKG